MRTRRIKTGKRKSYIQSYYTRACIDTGGYTVYCQKQKMIWKRSQAYICHADELPPGAAIPSDVCLVYMGMSNEVDLTQYRRVNILIVDMHQFAEFSNMLMEISQKYTHLERKLEEHFQNSQLVNDVTMDLMAELVGEPLCMMDANYNVFAFRQKFKPIDDKLWCYLEKYGYHYYDIVCRSHLRREEVAKEKTEDWKRSTISADILCV